MAEKNDDWREALVTSDGEESAFPLKAGEVTNFGITIRDYFAAKAMASLLAVMPDESPESHAKVSYLMADSMLRARRE